MNDLSLFDWLQTWTIKQLDGDWEHEHGVKLYMLDNPGWAFSADLANYECILTDIKYILVEKNPNDWHGCKIEDSYIYMYGDIKKLKQIVVLFHNIIKILDKNRASNKKFTNQDLKKMLDQVNS